MIYPNSVNTGIHTILSSDTTLVNSNVTIELNTLYNLDPNRTPWIGVYNNTMSVVPHRVQRPLPWMVTYSPILYVQDIRYDDESDVAERLNDLLTTALTAINSDRTLMGSVDILKGWEITPFELDIDEDTAIYAYEVVLTAERRA